MTDNILPPTVVTSTKGHNREGRHILGIIGTGNYAVSLSKRLTATGFSVIIGSRHPEKRKSKITHFSGNEGVIQVTSISECLTKCRIIFVAIHVDNFKTTLSKYEQQTNGKIFIDISNREYRHATQSNADILALVLPRANIVKGFNSISAHTMEDLAISGASHRVFVASDDPSARCEVGDLAKAMGFSVVDLGGLKSALDMEDFVLKVFSRWTVPFLLTFGIFNMWTLYILYIYFIETSEFQWEQVFLKVLNKPLCMTAITTLAFTYLPGHVASFLQIYNGTKHKPFPPFLDKWLKCRKQLGLISFFLVICHVIASILLMSPTYYRTWFHPMTVTFPANTTLTSDLALPVSTSWMEWKGEAASLVGLTAFIGMAVIALTSIPSVGESLNWAEWQCVHTKLGYLVLFLAVAHVCIMGIPSWVKDKPIKIVKSITFLSILLPVIVLFLKFIFLCPPLRGYIWKIRRGWERPDAQEDYLPVVVETRQVQRLNGDKDRSKENGVNKGFDCSDGVPNGAMVCGSDSSSSSNSGSSSSSSSTNKSAGLTVCDECDCSAV